MVRENKVGTVHEVVPASRTFDGEGSFRLFGVGNEKRDMTMLLRGDLAIKNTVGTSFFGCVNCGNMSFVAMDKGCPKCGSGSSVYFFDGAWKNCTASVKVGIGKDVNVSIIKM
jgi:ribosomal protein L37E